MKFGDTKLRQLGLARINSITIDGTKLVWYELLKSNISQYQRCRFEPLTILLTRTDPVSVLSLHANGIGGTLCARRVRNPRSRPVGGSFLRNSAAGDRHLARLPRPSGEGRKSAEQPRLRVDLGSKPRRSSNGTLSEESGKRPSLFRGGKNTLFCEQVSVELGQMERTRELQLTN